MKKEKNCLGSFQPLSHACENNLSTLHLRDDTAPMNWIKKYQEGWLAADAHWRWHYRGKIWHEQSTARALLDFQRFWFIIYLPRKLSWNTEQTIYA
jgi:hypothetical protein